MSAVPVAFVIEEVARQFPALEVEALDVLLALLIVVSASRVPALVQTAISWLSARPFAFSAAIEDLHEVAMAERMGESIL